MTNYLGALARLAQSAALSQRYARDLCDIGPKYAGTPGELVARDYILDALRQAGYTPAIEAFEYLHYMPHSARLELLTPLKEGMRAEPLQFSAAADVEGELMYVGDGSLAQLTELEECGANLEGKLVVTTGWPPFLLYELAEQRKAAGYIVVTRAPDNLIAVGSAVLSPRQGTMPGVTIGNEDGHRLLALLLPARSAPA